MNVTTLTRPLDQIGGQRLRKAIRKQLSQGALAHAIDIRDLPALDSPTLAALIGVLRAVRESGGSLSLLANQPPVLKILSITSLDKVFPIHASVADARTALEAAHRIPA